jgi:hypothetical protein
MFHLAAGCYKWPLNSTLGFLRTVAIASALSEVRMHRNAIRGLARAGIAALVLLGAAANSEAKCPTGLAGPSMNWAGAVCEWRVGTDDFFSPSVQECLKQFVARDHLQSAPAEICKRNEQYKSELCKAWVEDGLEKSVASCMRSSANIPREVSHGIGG